MPKEISSWKVRVLGVIYILISLLAYFNVFYYQRPESIFWFCYIGILIIGIGMLIKNSDLIKSQLYILTIPNIVWTIDFLSYLAGGDSFFGIAEYFFLAGPLLPKIVTLQHLITIPASIYVFYHLKLRKNKIWLASITQLALIFFVTKALTSNEANINCVYKACGNLPFQFSDGIYPLMWLILGILMVFITRVLLLVMPFLWKSRIEDIYD